MARVKFQKLTLVDYNAIAVKDNNTLYFAYQLDTPVVGKTRIIIYNGSDMLFDWVALDENGKLDPGIIPSIAITDTYSVPDIAAMLTLENVQVGDIAIVSSENKTYILSALPATTESNWKWLKTPTDAVLSVNTKTGAVTLRGSDIQVSTTDTRLISVALGALADQVNALVTGVSSVNGQTGPVLLSGLNIQVAGTTTGKFWDSSDATYWNSQIPNNRDSRSTTPATSLYAVGFALRTPQVASVDPMTFVKLGTNYTNGLGDNWTIVSDPLSLTQVIAYLERFAITDLGAVSEANRNLAYIQANYIPNNYPAGNIFMTSTNDGDYDYYDYYWAPPTVWNHYQMAYSETSDSRSVAEAMHDVESRASDLEDALTWN